MAAADGAVSFLLQKFDTLIAREWNLFSGIKTEVGGLKNEFEMMRAILKEADDAKRESNEQVRVWIKQVRDLAYDIEDILDMYAFHTCQHSSSSSSSSSSIYPKFLRWKRSRSISVLVQDMKNKLSGVKEMRERYQLIASSPQASSSCQENYKHFQYPRVASLYTDEADIVGIEEPRDKLMAWAVNGESSLKVVFLVGMAGLGKTLVAKKVYEGTKKSFDCCAWIPISVSQKKEELLWTILKRLFESNDEPIPREYYTISIVQLMDKMRSFLQHRRYIVVFDDLWDKDVWEFIKYALPNRIHSRVIITTRRGDIAHFYHHDSVGVYNLQPLPLEKAQELFYNKTFQSSGVCPSGLIEWSGKFLKQCEGLPLGIVAISNLLANTEKTADAWRKLHDSLGSELDSNGHLSSVTNVISPSYDDLPYSLKYCLLYFSIFPEEYSIKRRKLIRLWISEGLVKEVMGKTLEEVGEDYLKELIQRSLIVTNEVDFDGQPKTCRVHHLLHKIIFAKSQEENFCGIYIQPGAYLNEKVRRLSIQRSCTNMLHMNYAHCRSFFMSGILRHLLVYRYNLKSYVTIDCAQGFKVCNGIRRLVALQKLSLIKANGDNGIISELENLTQLRKLGVTGLKEQDGGYLCRSIMNMKNLQSLDLASIHENEYLDLSLIHDPPMLLQRLYLKGQLRNIPDWICSLHDLVRIRLKWSKLDCSPIDALQDRPNLVELQLLDAYTGKKLVFYARKFPSLKILELEKMEALEEVRIRKGSLDNLEKLIIRRCEKIKIVLQGIDRLPHLKELHLYEMPDKFLNGIEKNGGKFRQLVQHIPVIYSFTLDTNGYWKPRDLS
ncbi:Disease resistance protein RPH8A, putative [Ricinus communis]|uniref:Disease resistance protein RPH8A, putative n=1 Tax=Ricinus communis TaxID=3988 RepID=B9SQ65_RICCO|nr:Disease resistance protein RPH8A, putative [Ricinus communis]